jgi:GT2 family glycosyltransferase
MIGAPARIMQEDVEISVIVVNYGTADLARQAVDSVLAHRHGGRKVDIHLVDNASPGEDRAILAAAALSDAWRGRVIFYPEETNHGFAGGNNVVLRALAARPQPPDKVFLLNPDAQIDNEAVAILAEALDRDPAIGLVGAGVLQPGAGPAVAAFRFPGLISEFCRVFGVGPVYRLLRRWQVPLPPDRPEGPVDWVTGAAVMARFRVLRDLGFFDPGFFLYFEEVDLMRRARAAGWSVWYVPRARVSHFEGVATGVKSGLPERRRRPAYWYRSWARYFRNAYGRGGAAGIACAVLLGASLHYPLAFARGKKPSLPLRFIPDFWTHAARALFLGEGPQPKTGARAEV